MRLDQFGRRNTLGLCRRALRDLAAVNPGEFERWHQMRTTPPAWRRAEQAFEPAQRLGESLPRLRDDIDAQPTRFGACGGWFRSTALSRRSLGARASSRHCLLLHPPRGLEWLSFEAGQPPGQQHVRRLSRPGPWLRSVWGQTVCVVPGLGEQRPSNWSGIDCRLSQLLDAFGEPGRKPVYSVPDYDRVLRRAQR